MHHHHHRRRTITTSTYHMPYTPHTPPQGGAAPQFLSKPPLHPTRDATPPGRVPKTQREGWHCSKHSNANTPSPPTRHQQGTDKRQKEFRDKGKLLARERLALLLDEDSPFLEIGSLCGYGIKGVPDGNALIGGIGVVSGVEIVVVTNVPTVGRGAMDIVSGKKWNRCSEISINNNLPFIQLLESAGQDLNKQFEGFHSAPNPFYRLANRSAQGTPTVCVVMGTCIAGG